MPEKAKVPAIRFKDFTDAWEQRKWNETVDISTNMVDPKSRVFDELPHVAPGNIESFTGQLYDNVKLIKEENLISGKFRFHAGDIIYGKINPQLGKYVFAMFDGLTSADAYVLNAKNDLHQKFLFALLQTKDFYEYSVSVSKRSGIPKINRDELNAYSYFAPSTVEQRKIGQLFLSIDNLITLQQRKLLKLKNVKKAMLEKMFPKNGSSVPEIRFAGFTDAWEQRKVKDLFKATRGYVLAATKTSESQTEKTPYPVYSSQTKDNGLMGYYTDYLYEDAITWTTDGANAGTVKYRSEKFYCTNVSGVLLSDQVRANQMIAEALNNISKKYVSYVGNPKLMNNIMSDIEIKLPKQENEREQISDFFVKLDHLITLHQRKYEKLQNLKKACLEKMFV